MGVKVYSIGLKRKFGERKMEIGTGKQDIKDTCSVRRLAKGR